MKKRAMSSNMCGINLKETKKIDEKSERSVKYVRNKSKISQILKFDEKERDIVKYVRNKSKVS